MPTPTTTIMDKGVTGNSTAVSCAKKGQQSLAGIWPQKVKIYFNQSGSFYNNIYWEIID